MKGVLPWLVHWACPVGIRDFCSALAALVSPFQNILFLTVHFFNPVSQSWMKEVKGIRHGGGGAYLRCPVFTTVQFSLHDEGSSEYIRVCEERESLRPNF
jgi:hypothetical protein